MVFFTHRVDSDLLLHGGMLMTLLLGRNPRNFVTLFSTTPDTILRYTRPR